MGVVEVCIDAGVGRRVGLLGIALVAPFFFLLQFLLCVIVIVFANC